MASTRKKLEGPVRAGQWGLQVDRLAAPSMVTILRFADSSRHTRSSSEIGAFRYDDDLDTLALLVTNEAAIPPSTARALARDLIAKVHSPRARDLEDQERPPPTQAPPRPT